VEVVASLSQGRTAAAQCGLFTYKSVPVIFEPPCILYSSPKHLAIQAKMGTISKGFLEGLVCYINFPTK